MEYVLVFLCTAAISILWYALLIFKVISKKLNFDNETGSAIMFNFDYSAILAVFVVLSFCAAIYAFKFDRFFSVVTILFMLIISIGIVLYYLCNHYMSKKDVNKEKSMNCKKFQSISSIIVSIGITILDIVSIIKSYIG